MQAVPTRRIDYPDGESLNRGTIEHMAALVRARHEHPEIRARALAVLTDADAGSMDYDAQIRAVWDFVRTHVRYARDPLGAELVTDPLTLDRQIEAHGFTWEDCESMATYAATVLAAIGLRSEFETQNKDQRNPDLRTHCSLRVLQPRSGEWISFDLVGDAAFPDDFELGDTLQKPGERVERWTLDGNRKGEIMRTLAGIVSASDFGMGDAQSTITEIASSTGQGAAQGSSFGPWGAVIGGVLNLAGSIVSATTGKPLGTALPGGPVPLTTVGVEHKIDLPTVSKSAQNKLLTVAGIGAAVLIGMKLLKARRS